MSLCRSCPNALGRGNKTGYCRRCAAKRKFDCPAFRERHAATTREAIKRTKPWIKANAAMPKGSEPRVRAGRNQSNTKLAHIPSHLRPLYRELTRVSDAPAAEVLESVLHHDEVERARIRKELMGCHSHST